MTFRKIINDPVYGFITIEDELIFQIISHPYYQRLRRIKQMALAQMVYPGAVHTRLHHSLGAYHLMCNALHELRSKGVIISPQEEQAAKIAILLHDIGHAPYSHALEKKLITDIGHEDISLMLIQQIDQEFNNGLSLAMEVFQNAYERPFLHQLISGQLDVDRMDYLIRDSFFTGVSEGVIGYDRIIKMLTVQDNQLMIEEKGIHSIEKFLISRRFMYWQVYLHKTVLCAEQMLVKIIDRAKEIGAESPSPVFNFFLNNAYLNQEAGFYLREYCSLDDSDILFSIKTWTNHEDVVLSTLCSNLLNRNLLKIRFSSSPIPEAEIDAHRARIAKQLNVPFDDTKYLCFSGAAKNTTYDEEHEFIKILFKDGSVRDISAVDNALINESLFGTVKKFYICFMR